MKNALTAALFCAVLLGGCTGNLLEMDDVGEVYQRTSGASVARLDSDGNLTAAFHGLAPTVSMQDDTGTWFAGPGPYLKMTFPVGDRIAVIISPNDVEIEGMSYTREPAPGQPAFYVAKISANISEPLDRHVSAVTVALAALEGMTKAEAEATVKKWEAAGDMLPGVIDLLKVIVTTF